jgi:hypothetical protein
MMENTLRYRKPEKQSTRSTVRFQWDFRAELQKTIDILEVYFEEELWKHFVVDSVLAWNNEIKIRINDDEKNIRRVVNCIFRYHHDEQKFWNINIELGLYELSKKTKVYFVGTFSIIDRERIKKILIKDVIQCIQAIY